MIKELSKPQMDTLGQAYAEKNNVWRTPGEYGWFYAMHHECAPVITRWQTCASLCGLGLLEFETVGYIKRKGEWRPENRYRITEDGERYWLENKTW